jgi:hypothetical protein
MQGVAQLPLILVVLVVVATLLQLDEPEGRHLHQLPLSCWMDCSCRWGYLQQPLVLLPLLLLFLPPQEWVTAALYGLSVKLITNLLLLSRQGAL